MVSLKLPHKKDKITERIIHFQSIILFGDWLDTMITFSDDILNVFKPCFSRTAAFRWFVVIVTAFLFRSDKLGVTSVIRDLALRADTYESLLHFFRASKVEMPKVTPHVCSIPFAPIWQSRV